MGIAIFLRTQSQSNNFRNTILDIIEDKSIDYVIMTYPYFQEDDPLDQKGYSILDTPSYTRRNSNSLSNIICNRSNFKLVTLAMSDVDYKGNKGAWRIRYDRFVANLSANIPIFSVNYDAYIVDSWNPKLHAKFTIGCKEIANNYVPVVAVLGSSNLTRPAFGEETIFNYETDIVLWNDQEYNFNVLRQSDQMIAPLIANSEKYNHEQEYIDCIFKLANDFIEDHGTRINDDFFD